MERVAFCVEHGAQIQASIAQQVEHLKLTAEKWTKCTDGPAFTGHEDGCPYVCSGVLPVWYGRWCAWSAISDLAGPKEMLWIHRHTLKFLDDVQSADPERYRRIEATARVDQPDAMRWLGMLGFVYEGKLRCYDASGLDHIQYARISCHLTQPRQHQSGQ